MDTLGILPKAVDWTYCPHSMEPVQSKLYLSELHRTVDQCITIVILPLQEILVTNPQLYYALLTTVYYLTGAAAT